MCQCREARHLVIYSTIHSSFISLSLSSIPNKESKWIIKNSLLIIFLYRWLGLGMGDLNKCAVNSPQEAYVLEFYSSCKIREFTISFVKCFFSFVKCHITSLKWRVISSFYVLTANTLEDSQFLQMCQGLSFFFWEKTSENVISYALLTLLKYCLFFQKQFY